MTIAMAAMGLLTDIEVRVTVELGATSMKLRDICNLAGEQVVMLDRLIDEPLELKVNGKPVARGEVVAEGSRFGIRIIELIGQDNAGAQTEAVQGENGRSATSQPTGRRTERRAPPPTVERA